LVVGFHIGFPEGLELGVPRQFFASNFFEGLIQGFDYVFLLGFLEGLALGLDDGSWLGFVEGFELGSDDGF
jgi:hypothetical protein